MNALVAFSTSAMLAVLTVSAMASHTVAVFAPKAAPAIGVEITYVGVYVSIVYATGMFVGVVTGPLVGRYGAIRVCQLTMLAAALGMGALALGSPVAAATSAVLLGVAHGPFNPASAHVLMKVSTPRSRPLIFSIKQTGVPVGAALAGALIPPLVILVGWRAAALAVAVFAMAVFAGLQPLRGTFDADRNRGQHLRGLSLVAPLRLVLTDRVLRPLAIISFAYAGCQLALASFFVVYLAEVIEMPLLQAGLVFATSQAAGIFGRILWGAIAGRLVGARSLLIVLGLVMGVSTALLAVVTPESPIGLIYVLGVVLGASSLGWNGVNLAEIVARAPNGKISDATGGVQFVMFTGIVVIPPLFGVVVNVTGSYPTAFLLLAALSVGASVFLSGAARTVSHAPRMGVRPNTRAEREIDTRQ